MGGEIQNRWLEFVGDSDTAGWCADGNRTTGDDANAFEDAAVTWAAQLARAVGAELTAQAISGIGVVDWPIGPHLARALPFAPRAPWDYASSAPRAPDAVVLLVGPNDSDPDGAAFGDAYVQLLEQLSDAYAWAADAEARARPPPLVSVCGGSINGLEPCAAIEAATAAYNGRARARGAGAVAAYATISREEWETINARGSPYLGCDWHYSEQGHAVLAASIEPQLRAILGW